LPEILITFQRGLACSSSLSNDVCHTLKHAKSLSKSFSNQLAY